MVCSPCFGSSAECEDVCSSLVRYAAAAVLSIVLLDGNAAATGAARPAPVAAGGTVTFANQVAPLLRDRCGACHHPGGVAPFSVHSHAEVRPWARAIRNAVRTRSMPPWKPEPGYGGPFVGEQRLSDAEIDLIAAWVDAGAPEGERGDPTPWPVESSGWRLGEPDLVIEMPEPYMLRAEGADVLRKFAIPIPVPERRYVQGVEFQPGNPKVVHHANMKIDPTPASRRLDAGDPAPGYDGVTPFSARFPFGFFLGWTPGQVRPLAAEGMAWALEAGSDLLLEMHLTPSGEPETVRSRIGFFFTAEPPTKVPFTIRLGRQDLDIPAGVSDYRSADRYVLPVDVEVHGIQPHAHYLATRVRGYARLPDGTERPLIAIDDWDFHWQDSYRYAEPFVLPRGTELAMEFIYDNSAANPANPHAPPRRVTWGQLSANEMGDLWIQVLPRRAADLDRLVADRRPMELAEDIVGFEMVLAADPDQRMVHDDVALLYTQFGRIPEAARHYRESVRLAPQSSAAAYNLGTALLQLGALDDAVAELERALQIDPAYALAHNNLGAALKLRGDLAEAIPHYREAVRLRPNDGEALYNLANALLTSGALDDAVALYGRAIAAQPDAAEPFAELALVLATHPDPARRDPPRAVRLAERAAELTGRAQPGILDVLAAVYAAAGAFDRAVAAPRPRSASFLPAGMTWRPPFGSGCTGISESRRPFARDRNQATSHDRSPPVASRRLQAAPPAAGSGETGDCRPRDGARGARRVASARDIRVRARGSAVSRPAVALGAVLRPDDGRRAELSRLGPGDSGRRLAGRRGLLPGAVVPVLPGGGVRAVRSRPAGRATGPERARRGGLRPVGVRGGAILLARRRRGGRVDAGGLRPGDLLRRSAAEGLARPVPALCGSGAPVPAERTARAVARMDLAGARARRAAADARARPRVRRCRARVAGRVGRGAPRPARPGRRARPGAGPGGAARRRAQRAGGGRVRADDGAVRAQLLHRQQSGGGRHLPAARVRAGGSALRASGRRAGRRAGARRDADPRAGLALLDGAGARLHPDGSGGLAASHRAQGGAGAQRGRGGRHGRPAQSRRLVVPAENDGLRMALRRPGPAGRGRLPPDVEPPPAAPSALPHARRLCGQRRAVRGHGALSVPARAAADSVRGGGRGGGRAAGRGGTGTARAVDRRRPRRRRRRRHAGFLQLAGALDGRDAGGHRAQRRHRAAGPEVAWATRRGSTGRYWP